MNDTGQARIKAAVQVNKNGCWIWQKTITRDGYGKLGQSSKAHRVAYEAWKGPIPEGLHIDHLCRVRSCVNPGHLEAVEPLVNSLRGYSLPAVNARKTHCVHGHPFSEANTYRWTSKGGRVYRVCRACNAAAAARSKARRRAA